jgi:hypothetical protein
MHKHQCSLCRTLWQHGEEWDNDVWAHACPACGCHQFRIYKEPGSAASPAAAAGAEPDPVAKLGDPNWFVRATTAFSLDVLQADPQRTVPKLAEMVRQDPYPLVRLAAVEALWRFGAHAQAEVPTIARALTDRQDYVRRAAALTLGNLGPVAAAALSPLTSRLGDSNPAVRQAAAVALQKIGPVWPSPVNEVWVSQAATGAFEVPFVLPDLCSRDVPANREPDSSD